MKGQPLTIDTIFNLLRERAAKNKAPVIVDASFAISPNEARLVDLKPGRALEVIRY
jgi:hypothetical protein